ncbi:hypothetical protein QM787_03895 [Rhodococcus ruber]|uniref:Uncharacterized protein n=1 Tax=Rhodococcus ruber TaxID=1830 RepID=A0A098BVK1_9NOCA|nr:hypothetical protein [Rhodococcus ruber]MCD2127643.1 hypothetical protein [Rhodococcus ruber]MCZ4504299.1 hypothetical protein [Rhodococcus ruber]MCZ4529465.1 hypothetical protein [Rhodococcus ruber]MCZ4620960.1 hypothetical protein [Rhodococcus ruber]MDI9966984.1 hypothetical protein [Rhodococcus ruber]
MSIRDRVSKVLADELTFGKHGFETGTSMAEYLYDRLESEGFAVVALPEPEIDKFDNPDFSNEHIRLTVYRDGCVQLETPEYFGVNAGIHPFQLRDLAQRCLAAAKVAEARQL